MAGNLNPDSIRTRTFSTGRRGFDRAEVEAFLAEVAEVVAKLRLQVESSQANLAQLGVTELPDLKVELDRVTDDIREVLQSAREAAEDMRVRAAADAESWRLEARHESAAMLDAAKAEAERLRQEAWEASEEMLRSVAAESEELQSKAGEDALFIRAEAEKEALRHTGDAKRDADEMIKAAKEESERLVAAASAQAAEIMDEAQAGSALAQERVAALDGRRAELLEELDELRVELAEVEDRIEGRTAELTHATTDPSESSVRIITEESEPAPMGEWLDDDATVRLIPPPSTATPPPLLPVDADELVAEVESLRQVPQPTESQPEALSGGSGSSAEDASLAFEIESGFTPVVADAAATAVMHTEEPPSDAAPSPVDPEPGEPPPEEAQSPTAAPPIADVAEEATVAAVLAVDEEPAVLDQQVEAPEAPVEPPGDGEEPAALTDAGDVEESAPTIAVESDVAERVASQPDPVDDLFARLRTPTTPDSESADESEPSSVAVEEETAEDDPAEPVTSARTAEEPESDGGSPSVDPMEPEQSQPDPWHARDEALLPITNQALREAKRQIVDVQNAVLEELRTQPSGWRPERAVFEPVEHGAADIEGRCADAGFAAAAAATGRQVEAEPTLGPLADSVEAMLDDLRQDVVDAIATAEPEGPRQTNAAVGRIFRAWRTDEAERRIQALARSAYNAAVAAHCEATGVAYRTNPEGRLAADPETLILPVS